MLSPYGLINVSVYEVFSPKSTNSSLLGKKKLKKSPISETIKTATYLLFLIPYSCVSPNLNLQQNYTPSNFKFVLKR